MKPPNKGYERVKRWREKHRGLYNLRQRQARKRGKNPAYERAEPIAESAKPAPVPETAVAPKIFRDDYGRVITEAQWNELQKRKAEAAKGGYVIDEFSQ